MNSNAGSGTRQPDRVYSFGYPDAAALSAGQPVCLDTAFVSGGTAYDGQTIQDDEAVVAALATPLATGANAHLLAGIIADDDLARGQFARFIMGGKQKARVKNEGSGTIALAVGDVLVLSLGHAYFVPLFQAVAAGGSTAISNHGALPRAIVTKAASILTGVTTRVEAFVYLPRAPEPVTWNYTLAGVNVTNLTIPLGICRGAGRIIRGGFGLEVCGSAGTATLDVKINSTSIFTTQPVIVNDGTDPVHTLKNTAAADVGTAGSYGTVNAAANTFAPGDKIYATVTYASSPAAQAGLNVQADGFYY